MASNGYSLQKKENQDFEVLFPHKWDLLVLRHVSGSVPQFPQVHLPLFGGLLD